MITLSPYWLAVVGLEVGDYVVVMPNKKNELVVRPYKQEKVKDDE